MNDLKLEEINIDDFGVCSFKDDSVDLNQEIVEEYLASSSMADLACLDSCCGCKNIC